jgi:phosphoserine aminotransferase
MIPHMAETPDIRIPAELLPKDGRFGAGPSKVRSEQVAALVADAPRFLGTSHRQKTVKSVVGDVRDGLAELFSLPEGYEVLLGNGGTTCFWDAATFGLIEKKSQHLSFGEFSSKFATAASQAPFLDDPEIIKTDPGTHPEAIANSEIDLYALTHNETSTGVSMKIARPNASGLVAVDATSAAGGLFVDANEFDCYYFAPQKSFASDGGLWLALCSPAAIERIESLAASERWVPAFFDLKIALDNSRLNQTYNTPALATIHLLSSQIKWINENGGLDFSTGRCDRSAEILYTWAEKSGFARPFVEREDQRSHVIATIDFVDAIDASQIAAVLRAHGIVDTEPYRKLGRNQLRIAMFPAIDPDDIALLCGAITHVVGALS